jgi:ferrous iron transport protein B
MSRKIISAALVGAPNCGKSTLFNRLARTNVPVGNRAGVTVDKTIRLVRGEWLGPDCPDIHLTDLPGIRSLSPHSEDEEVTLSTLRDGKTSIIINVLGASTLERCLALSAALRSEYSSVPMICAVNMCDELEKDGISLSAPVLSRMLGVPTVAVSAADGTGFNELRDIICTTARATADGTIRKNHDRSMPSNIIFPRSEGGRAEFASRAASAALSRTVSFHKPTDLADKVITHPAAGIPVFLAVMAIIFWLTFGFIGNSLTSFFESMTITPLAGLFDYLASKPGFPVALGSFLSGCVLGGVGAVVSFLPRITLLFILLSLLEDSGYMARASFIMDALLRRAGMSGRAFVPLLLGFGCSVTAVMSARTLGDRNERLRCIIFLPIISCSARAPIYSVISSSFFPGAGWFAVLCVYMTGIVMFLICSGIARSASHAEVPMFVTELPRYRIPRLWAIIPAAAVRAKEFLIRAGGIIFLSTSVVWLLSFLTPRFSLASVPDESILAVLSGFVSPLFSPLGFGNWRAVAALICGIGAKEGVISALGVLTGGNPAETLAESGIFTPASALSFTIFSSMYVPCAATMPVMRSESGSAKLAAAGIGIMFLAAYLLSAIVYLFAKT